MTYAYQKFYKTYLENNTSTKKSKISLVLKSFERRIKEICGKCGNHAAEKRLPG